MNLMSNDLQTERLSSLQHMIDQSNGDLIGSITNPSILSEQADKLRINVDNMNSNP